MKRLRREVRGRGVVAYRVAPKTVRVAWRYLSSDPPNAAFNVYRDGRRVNSVPIADVTYFDGRDEILYGHMCVDHDGKGLWTTGYGHGAALHLVQASPDTPGLRLWTCHEEAPYGVSLIDAQTGRTLLRQNGPSDTGSCNAMDIDPDAPGV